ncbi:MAG: hypothetical protein ACFBRM_08080 [Pikeienuella sp.]
MAKTGQLEKRIVIVLFLAVSLLMMLGVWNFGSPPPKSVMWPVERAEVTEVTLDRHGIAGAYRARLTVRLNDGRSARLPGDPSLVVSTATGPVATVRPGERIEVAVGASGTVVRDAPGPMFVPAMLVSLFCLFLLGFGLRELRRELRDR